MKKPWLVAVFLVLGGLLLPQVIQAQRITVPSPLPTAQEGAFLVDRDRPADLVLEGSPSADATTAAEVATPAAQKVVEKVTEKKPDITEPEGEVVGRLEKYLIVTPVGPLGLTTLLQYAIRNAVAMGVPPNTIVLVLLFPLVAALVAAARHLVGLRGFGIFTPAILSVAFVATGVFVGIFLFLVILLVAMLGRRILRGLKLQYLPRMALLLWFVSVGVLAALLIAPILNLEALVSLNIFPILILMLLAESFIEVQIGKSKREAMELTVETIILALICSLVLSLDAMQRLALLYPELLLVSVAVFDIFMGKYVGLRYTEYLKFRQMVKKK